MSFLRDARVMRAREARAAQLGGNTLADALAWERGNSSSWQTMHVTPSSAKSHPAVWRCIQIIAGTGCNLPFDGVRKVGPIRVPIEPTPKLLASPSGEVDPRAWKWQAIESLLLHSNIIGRIVERDASFWPTQVELVDPATVSTRKVGGRYEWKFAQKPIPADDVWHVAFNPPPGTIFGEPLIVHATKAIAQGLAAQDYAAGWFTDTGHPSQALTNAKPVDQEQAKTVKARFLDAVRRNREPVVMGDGWKLETLQSTPAESSLVELWAQNTTSVANYFGVPPELIGGQSGGSMTYTNLEARALDLVKFCVSIWLSPLEGKLTASMPRPQVAKINYDALLRADTMTRYQSHDLAIRGGFRSRDEARALEDEAPIPDGTGGAFLWPPYTTTLPPTQTGAPNAGA